MKRGQSQCPAAQVAGPNPWSLGHGPIPKTDNMVLSVAAKNAPTPGWTGLGYLGMAYASEPVPPVRPAFAVDHHLFGELFMKKIVALSVALSFLTASSAFAAEAAAPAAEQGSEMAAQKAPEKKMEHKSYHHHKNTHHKKAMEKKEEAKEAAPAE